MNKPFQRKGSESNTQVGNDFEKKVRKFFTKKGIHLVPNVSVFIGINGRKLHKFDLGNAVSAPNLRFVSASSPSAGSRAEPL